MGLAPSHCLAIVRLMIGDARLLARVGRLERPALQHSHGQRVEVARADGEVVGRRALVGIVHGAPLDLERVGERSVGSQRHGAGDGHRGHARLARQALDERLVESQEILGRVVAREVPEHLRRQHALGRGTPWGRSAADGGWPAATRRPPAARPIRPPARRPAPVAGAGAAGPDRRPRPV